MQGKKLYACCFVVMHTLKVTVVTGSNFTCISASVFISFFYSDSITFSKQLQLQLHSADILEIKKEKRKEKQERKKKSSIAVFVFDQFSICYKNFQPFHFAFQRISL